MRKIIAHLATSADGFIARRDGGIDWLDRPEPKGGYGMAAFFKTIDTVVMGRKTYDVALKFGMESYPGVKNYVLTRDPSRTSTNVEFVNVEDVKAFAKSLRRKRGKDIWLVGGADVFSAFLDAGQLDELVMHVMPVLIGEGLPLLTPHARTAQLDLIATRKYSDGVVRLDYAPHGR